MKKQFLLWIVLCCSFCGYAQKTERLSQTEITENKTPQAVAYNFVKSIVDEDYATTVELMTTEYFFELMPALFVDGIPINRLFSTEYTHNIVDMRPVVKLGYEIVITESKELDSKTYFDEESNYRGRPAFSVTFGCVNADNKRYDGSQGPYDTETTVLLVQEEDVWKVLGFK